MAELDEVIKAVDDKLLELIKAGFPRQVLELAEARAWLTSPAQPHGGTPNS